MGVAEHAGVKKRRRAVKNGRSRAGKRQIRRNGRSRAGERMRRRAVDNRRSRAGEKQRAEEVEYRRGTGVTKEGEKGESQRIKRAERGSSIERGGQSKGLGGTEMGKSRAEESHGKE
jgi:hypothetical protein